MPRLDENGVPINAGDLKRAYNQAVAGDAIRIADHRRFGITPGSRKHEHDSPPLKRRCDGCDMSKSAFPSTAEFDAHRSLCEDA